MAFRFVFFPADFGSELESEGLDASERLVEPPLCADIVRARGAPLPLYSCEGSDEPADDDAAEIDVAL